MSDRVNQMKASAVKKHNLIKKFNQLEAGSLQVVIPKRLMF